MVPPVHSPDECGPFPAPRFSRSFQNTAWQRRRARCSAHGSALALGRHRPSRMMFSVEMGISVCVEICQDSVSLPTPRVAVAGRLWPPAFGAVCGHPALRRGGHRLSPPGSVPPRDTHGPRGVRLADRDLCPPSHRGTGSPGRVRDGASQGGTWPSSEGGSALGPRALCRRVCHSPACGAVLRGEVTRPGGRPHGPLLSTEPHCRVSHRGALRGTAWPLGRKAVFFLAME